MAVLRISLSEQEKLFDTTAEWLRLWLEERANRSTIVVGLSGGRSIVGLLKALLKKRDLLRSIWPRLEFFMADERLVPLTHQDSNFRLLKEEFFDVLISEGFMFPAQLHPFQMGKYPTLEEDVVGYSLELTKWGQSFDLAILGIGEDAHLASLFPNHPSIRNEFLGYISVDNSPKPPAKRLSASSNMLLRTELVVGLFIGEGKRQAYENFLGPGLSVEACPAKILAYVPSALVVTDLDNQGETVDKLF